MTWVVNQKHSQLYLSQTTTYNASNQYSAIFVIIFPSMSSGLFFHRYGELLACLRKLR